MLLQVNSEVYEEETESFFTSFAVAIQEIIDNISAFFQSIVDFFNNLMYS